MSKTTSPPKTVLPAKEHTRKVVEQLIELLPETQRYGVSLKLEISDMRLYSTQTHGLFLQACPNSSRDDTDRELPFRTSFVAPSQLILRRPRGKLQLFDWKLDRVLLLVRYFLHSGPLQPLCGQRRARNQAHSFDSGGGSFGNSLVRRTAHFGGSKKNARVRCH